MSHPNNRGLEESHDSGSKRGRMTTASTLDPTDPAEATTAARLRPGSTEWLRDVKRRREEQESVGGGPEREAGRGGWGQRLDPSPGRRGAGTGEGQGIELAMYEPGTTVIGTGVLDYTFNGRRTQRIGNRHPFWSPHGVYPCQGHDQWVAIAVRDQGEWLALCRAMGNPDTASDPSFSDPIERRWNQEELDKIIASWTSARTSYQVMESLQGAGVPAGPVLTSKQALTDPQYLARGFFETVHNPPEVDLRPKGYVGRGWKFSESEASIKGPAPKLGEANDYVLAELLGMDPVRLKAFEDEWTLGRSRAGGVATGSVPTADRGGRGGQVP